MAITRALSDEISLEKSRTKNENSRNSTKNRESMRFEIVNIILHDNFFTGKVLN
jgi:hypothetical protein